MGSVNPAAPFVRPTQRDPIPDEWAHLSPSGRDERWADCRHGSDGSRNDSPGCQFSACTVARLVLGGVVLIAPSAASAYIRYASPNDGVATLVPIDRIPAYSEDSE
jgi:hypothetical protein